MNNPITLLDVILKLPEIVSEFRTDKVEADNGYITIVTDVAAALPPHTDFEFNGKILASDTRAKIIEDYGNQALDKLCDFKEKNIKICWSNQKLEHANEGAIFLPNLVIRLTGQDHETGTVNFITLRNRYGSSLVNNSYQVTKR